jgi:dihydrofolate reductase
MMVTLDGYFEGEDHDITWHMVDDEFNAFAIEQLAEVDTLIFGHRTYDLMAAYWPKEGMRIDPDTAKPMNQAAKIAVSHTSFTPEWANTRVLSENVFDEIRHLKENSGKAIAIFGSNNLCVSLMGEGLVEEFRIMVNPLALGKGSSLFTGLAGSINFKPIATREFKSGNVLLTYTRS